MAELTGKTIAELPEDSSLSGDELFVVMDNATSKRVALSTLRKQFMMSSTGLSANGLNIDELLEPNTYYVGDPSSVTGNAPSTGGTAYKLFVIRGATLDGVTRTWQIAYVLNSTCRELRRNYSSSGWNDWISLDIGRINDQLDALGGGNVTLNRFSISNGNNYNLALENYEHGILFFSSLGSNLNGIYAISCSGQGTVYARTMNEASAIALTAETNSLNIANNGSYYAYALFVKY
jgi:hypothetical protein